MNWCQGGKFWLREPRRSALIARLLALLYVNTVRTSCAEAATFIGIVLKKGGDGIRTVPWKYVRKRVAAGLFYVCVCVCSADQLMARLNVCHLANSQPCVWACWLPSRPLSATCCNAISWHVQVLLLLCCVIQHLSCSFCDVWHFGLNAWLYLLNEFQNLTGSQ